MEVERDRDRDLDQMFWRFHGRNPQVYDLLVRFTRQALKTDRRKRIGIRMIWERMRWEVMIVRDPLSEFKLNDNLTSRYARLIMAKEPDLSEAFVTRRLRS